MPDPDWAAVEAAKARAFRLKELRRQRFESIQTDLKGNNQAAKDVWDDFWPILDRVYEW